MHVDFTGLWNDLPPSTDNRWRNKHPQQKREVLHLLCGALWHFELAAAITDGDFSDDPISTVFPRKLALSFIQIQWSQEVTLFPMIETSQLITLQSLLALLQSMRHRPTLKRLVQDHGNALTNLRWLIVDSRVVEREDGVH
jgi:hypothetical protein